MTAAATADRFEFDFLTRPDEDLPYAALARARDAGPVIWCEALNAWLVTSYAAVREVLSDVTRFTSEGTPVAEVFGQQGMLTNDTPMHHTIRAVWARHVGRAAMDARREQLRANAAWALDEAEEALRRGEAVDMIQVFRRYVIRFIAETFAIPDDRTEVFHRWSELSANTPALGIEPGSEEEARHAQGRADVFALIDEQVAQRQALLASGAAPGDLIGLMVGAEGANGITAGIVRDNVFNFMLGALDTTEKWLGNIVLRLCSHPDERAELTARPDRIEAFVDEVMRCESVAQVIQRKVRAGGAELGGTALAGGESLMVLLGAANRDAAEFVEPDRFDLHRPVRPNLGFGFGFHHCLGINIAKAEAVAFVSVLLERWPALQVARCEHGESWALWGPRRLELRAA